MSWTSGGLEVQTLRVCLDGRVTPCVSPDVWAEYREVLWRRKFAAIRKRSSQMLRAIQNCALAVHPELRVQAATDEKDNRLRECAAAARAEYLVTETCGTIPKCSASRAWSVRVSF